MKRPKDIAYAKWLAQYYLSKRMLTRGELYDKLIKKEVEKIIVIEALDWVEEKRFIDDLDYAIRYIKDAANLKKRGKMRIIQELRMKKVSAENIETAFFEVEDEVDFDNALNIAITKKATNLDLQDRKDRDKLVGHLARKGFEIGEIFKAIDNYSRENI